MAFDGMVTRAVAIELNNRLTTGRIDKIYQPEKDELVFLVHGPEGKEKLYASCNSNYPGIYLSLEDYKNPPEPSSFCMLLRKHIQGARILGVNQVEAERIIEVALEGRDDLGYPVTKKLVVEIMGRHSNITLVNVENNLIIDSIKRLSPEVSRARPVLPGQPYVYPPSQNKVPFDQLTIFQLPDQIDDPSEFLLSHIQGISPAIARELSLGEDPESIVAMLNQMTASIKAGKITPRVYIDPEGTPAEFHVLPLHRYESEWKTKIFETVSQSISFYYKNRNISNRIKQKSTDLSKLAAAALKKQYLKKQRLSEDLAEANNSEDQRIYGELLTANLHLIQSGDRQVTVTNYYDGSPVTIKLDTRLSPSKNAQQYYKKYGKAKRAIKEKTLQLEETEKEIIYLESVVTFIDQATTTEEIDSLREELAESGYAKKKKGKNGQSKSKKVPFLSYQVDQGSRVTVGRNNRENDLLTFQKSSRTDIWFHAKDIPGSHVILDSSEKEPTEEAILQAAAIAAYYSKGRNSENLPVDYTQIRYVKKPNGAKPGMVIFTNNRTLYVNPALPVIK